MKVRIVQLLCPARHCVLATAYESESGGELPEIAGILRSKFAALVGMGANPHCGLCLSKDLHTDDQPTKFSSMAEAIPQLQEQEARMALTREYFKASKG